jgi:hypothetical protein
MLVYRIEDATNEGPYNGPLRIEAREALPCLGAGICEVEARHPMPCDDIPLWDCKRSEAMRFGFASLEQLHAWFNAEERETLSGIGFSLATYDAGDVLPGGRQVAFNFYTAKRVSTQPLT